MSARSSRSAISAVAHEGFLSHGRYRYLRVALLICVAVIAAYRYESPVTGSGGGTLLGYGLGTLGALMILWLAWLGIRRRSYRRTFGTLRGWTSAHVYLGLSLLVIATLHTGFKFGLNIHTVAYSLMVAVIVSGAYGVAAYSYYPSRITANRDGARQDTWLSELEEINERALTLAAQVSPDCHASLLTTLAKTRIGGSLRQRMFAPLLSDSDRQSPVMQLTSMLTAGRLHGDDAQRVRDLITQLTRRDQQVALLNRDLRFHARMRVWLLLHVPLTFGLLAALMAHVVSVFLYW